MSVRNLFPERTLFTRLAVALAFVACAGCGDESTAPQTAAETGTTEAKVASAATPVDVSKLPQKARQRLAAPPAEAVFGMIYFDTTKGKEYIFDGASWVPHDSTVDAYYAANKASGAAKSAALMVQADVCTDGDPSCTPTGAHGAAGTTPAGHYAFACSVCHKVGGRLVFDKNGPAYAAGKPAPTYDATAKTCSNVACHAASGTFTYYTTDWSDGSVVLTTISYGSGSRSTPSWYSTGAAGCSACHDDPPRNGSTGSNVWHSGYHGGQGPTGERNQCQFCHPDATSPGNGIGDTITNPSLHANGSVQVQATFTTACFGCH
ncbi:hypothetical protein GMST_40510 [Geomonas silvestris]|uniref:Uncharacterized protein n=1 Tax=Geomonas silvestris TaxID=2740184 RepID=A0A6V8MNU3_9BACT|nr:cytochrome C [Geomonas silvestris]GFO61726.1 hypothetical protein GMST_40510 [Geomonas silvestris]